MKPNNPLLKVLLLPFKLLFIMLKHLLKYLLMPFKYVLVLLLYALGWVFTTGLLVAIFIEAIIYVILIVNFVQKSFPLPTLIIIGVAFIVGSIILKLVGEKIAEFFVDTADRLKG